MGWFMSIIVGAAAGWIASMMMNKNEKMGALANIFVGIIGGSIGRFVLGLVNVQAGQGVVPSLLVGVFGAVILLWIINKVTGK